MFQHKQKRETFAKHRLATRNRWYVRK